MPGLMETAANNIAEKNKIDPFTNPFDESKGVAGRVDSLINQNSPLMQTAATNGAQQAAKRGLLNSSIGVQAGQQAVINSATPIANADASLYSQNSLANMAAKNQALTANAQMATTLGGQGLGLDNSNTQQDKSLTESGRQADQNNALQGRQVDAQIAQFAQTLGMSAQELQLKKDSLSIQDRQALDTLNLQKSQLAQNQSQFTDQMGARQKELDAQSTQFGQNLAQNQAQFTTQQATAASEREQKQKQFEATQQQQIVLTNLDSATKERLATIESEWRVKLGGDSNLTGSWQQMMSGISAIQNNANLEPAAKQTLINNTIASFQSYATFYGKMANVDVSALLNFGTVGSGGTKTPAAPITTEPVMTNGGYSNTPARYDDSGRLQPNASGTYNQSPDRP